MVATMPDRDVRLPDPLTWALTFLIGGPLVLGWMAFVVDVAAGGFSPGLLVSGLLWPVSGLLVPGLAPLTVLAAPLAGATAWAVLRGLLMWFPSLRHRRMRLAATAAACGYAVSAAVALAAAQLVVMRFESSAALATWRGLSPAGAFGWAGLIGALLACGLVLIGLRRAVPRKQM